MIYLRIDPDPSAQKLGKMACDGVGLEVGTILFGAKDFAEEVSRSVYEKFGDGEVERKENSVCPPSLNFAPDADDAFFSVFKITADAGVVTFPVLGGHQIIIYMIYRE